MSLSRLDFIRGIAASAGVASVGPWRLFAAPEGWTPPKAPNIAFGVVSDTHLRTDRTGKRIDMKQWPDKYLVAALRHFRELNVDAVVHCGDMADRGQIVEMQAHADVWRKAFPDDRAADGRKVERLFVMGNHDVDGAGYGTGFRVDHIYKDPEELKKHILATDLAGWWERIWGEKYEGVWHKEVRGYHFFGKHWGVADSELGRVIAENCKALALDVGDRPFFFLTHAITDAAFNKAICACRNGFGFFGHWHMSAANWRCMRLFHNTTPSVQCPAIYPYFNDGRWLGGGDQGIVAAPIEGKLQAGSWRQGLVVRVYDDMLVMSRYEYSQGGSLGADWIMPLGWARRTGVGGRKAHPLSIPELKKVIGAPEFRKGAKLDVVKCCQCGNAANPEANSQLENDSKGNNSTMATISVKIPLADGNPDSRVYAYEVVVTGGDPSRKLLKAVYAAGANMGVGREPNGGVTTLAIKGAELPQGAELTVAVRPMTSLGTRGKSIEARVAV